MSIGDRIKMVRGTLTQKQFALKIGAGQRSIYSWEVGHAAPGAKSLEAIHRVFGVDIHWLLTGEGERYIKKDDSQENDLPQAHESLAEYSADAPGLGQAVEMLATILGSGNQVFSQAVMSSLRASAAALNIMKQRNQQMATLVSELNDFRKRLAALEEQFQKEPEVEKGENLEKKPM